MGLVVGRKRRDGVFGGVVRDAFVSCRMKQYIFVHGIERHIELYMTDKYVGIAILTDIIPTKWAHYYISSTLLPREHTLFS